MLVHFVTGFYKRNKPNDYCLSELEQLCLKLARKQLPADAHFILHKPAGNKVIGFEAGAFDEVKLYSQEQFDRWAFAKVRDNPVHFSDRIRFQVLAEEGGLYLDTDVVLFKPLAKELAMSAFVSNEIDGRITLNNGFMWASRPGHPFFKHAFDLANGWPQHKHRCYQCTNRILLAETLQELGEAGEMAVLSPTNKYWKPGGMGFWQNEKPLPENLLANAVAWHIAGTKAGRKLQGLARYNEFLGYLQKLLLD